MTESKTVTKDPICGTTVDAATAIHAEGMYGETFYFCSDQCKQNFLSMPAGVNQDGKSDRIVDFAALPEGARGEAGVAMEKFRKS